MIDNKYIDYINRNQVQLERYKAGQARELKLKITELINGFTLKLLEVDQLSVTELNRLLADIKREQTNFYSDYYLDLYNNFDQLADIEATREAETLKSIYLEPDRQPIMSTVEQIIALALARPMQVRTKGAGVTLGIFIKEWGDSQVNLTLGAILAGYYQGQTSLQIIQRVKGTKSKNYQDGIISNLWRDSETALRTGYQHVSAIARDKTWRQNSDLIKGYRIVAVLDNKTSDICRSLDGRSYDLGKGPIPPFHRRCRSSTAAEINPKYRYLKNSDKRNTSSGAVNADLDYYTWLKTQPKAFQLEVLGKTRTKLFRDGGLTAKQFKDLQLDKNLRPITLEEFRKLSPQSFDSADI
jgi:SPP1 gp7 family putative phage head morphogenesis protein